MIHGILYLSMKQHQPLGLFDGHHPVLNIDPARQKVITWMAKDCWLAQAVDKRADHHSCYQDPDSSTVIVAWMRLDNRAEIANKLCIPSNQLIPLSDAQLVLRAYLHYGETCTEHLFGDFCFAIYDPRTKKIFCARDQMGVKPFYYYFDEHVFVFSSSLALFHVLDCVNVRPNMEWASKFLVANLSMDFHKTAYHNILKLPPAEQLYVIAGKLYKKSYFSFHTNKIQLRSSQAYVDLYLSELERAVKDRVQTEYPLGSEISGGIDSSTVTALAAKYFPGPLTDFHTFGFAHLEQEPQYILQVNQQYNIPNSYICCHNPLNLYNKSRGLMVLGAPVEHGNATGHEIFYDVAAKNNVRTLLSGFGGDEFVTSIHGDLYLYELLKNKQYFQLYKSLRGNALMRMLRLAKFRFYTDNQGGKISTGMRRAFASRWPDMIIADDLVRAYGIQNDYESIGDFDNGYNNLDQFTLEKRWVPFVATRMENCTLMAASYGVDYRWPLLDPRLIQCFLSIPSSEKFHKGMGRYLHRRAISGTVPKEIVWKVDKSMGERANLSEQFKAVLNDDLHPDLLPLLNIEKLRKQVSNASKRVTMGTGYQVKKNIIQVNQLDNWLKYYFSQGCHWASLPNND